jgi:hypothetical protein
MKVKFTHKEFTLVAGIVVAIIIMLTLWLNPMSADAGDVSRKFIQPVAKPAAKAALDVIVLPIKSILR